MGHFIALLLFLLLFASGDIGLIIGLALIFLFLCAITESWWILLVIILIFLTVGLAINFDSKQKTRHKVGKQNNTTKELELNDENIILLVRLVRRMPDDGRHSISQSNVGDLATSKQWNLCMEWFSRNANNYVIINHNTIRAKGRAEKVKLITQLLHMKKHTKHQLATTI